MQGRTQLIRRAAPWAGASLLLVLTVAALYAFTGAASSEPSRSRPAGAGDITYGPRDARVTVIEYSDFQCPACASYAQILSTLRKEYGDRVEFVFRFLPSSENPYAMVSARAAYAAFRQGKFWEMADLLYRHQDEWSSSDHPRRYFDSYATSLGLDLASFRQDMDAPATIAFIRAQRAEGKRAGVTHIPWFVVGGDVVVPRGIDEFERFIQQAG